MKVTRVVHNVCSKCLHCASLAVASAVPTVHLTAHDGSCAGVQSVRVLSLLALIIAKRNIMQTESYTANSTQ